jgi:hypothetical protein
MADDIKRFSKVDVESTFEKLTNVDHGSGLKDPGNKEANNNLSIHDMNADGQPGVEYGDGAFNGEEKDNEETSD